MDTSDKWFTLDNRGDPIWGSRGREFKSRQPDLVGAYFLDQRNARPGCEMAVVSSSFQMPLARAAPSVKPRLRNVADDEFRGLGVLFVGVS
jgi:hypothetical protein